jgi:hypothetical protein
MAQPNSRYANVGEATFVAPEGHVVVYLRRRLLPDPERVRGTLAAVRPGERVDTIAARTLGSPTQFHRLCDANGVADPMDVAEGALTQVTLPRPGAGG